MVSLACHHQNNLLKLLYIIFTSTNFSQYTNISKTDIKKQNLETEIEERINSEVESLKIQVNLLESELEISRMRAESSEEELRQLKATLRLSAKVTEIDASTSTHDDETKEIPKPPPPPPPPMPNLLNTTQTNNTFRSRSNSQTLNDAINDAQQKLQQTSELKNSKKATGRKRNFFSHRLFRSLSPFSSARKSTYMSNPFSAFLQRNLLKMLMPCILSRRENLTTNDDRESSVVYSKQSKSSPWLVLITSPGTFMKRMKILFYRSTADSILPIFYRVAFYAIASSPDLSFQFYVFSALKKGNNSCKYVNKSAIPSGITKGHRFVHQKVHTDDGASKKVHCDLIEFVQRSAGDDTYRR